MILQCIQGPFSSPSLIPAAPSPDSKSPLIRLFWMGNSEHQAIFNDQLWAWSMPTAGKEERHSIAHVVVWCIQELSIMPTIFQAFRSWECNSNAWLPAAESPERQRDSIFERRPYAQQLLGCSQASQLAVLLLRRQLAARWQQTAQSPWHLQRLWKALAMQASYCCRNSFKTVMSSVVQDTLDRVMQLDLYQA